MTRRIIGFAGKAGSGKTTAALHLVLHHGFERVRFAGPLKDMLRALGLREHEIEGYLKEQPCELLGGRTPRYAMQTLGTEWGREYIAPDLWIRAWRAAIDRVGDKHIVADDVRFPNEVEAVRSVGGHVVAIMRDGAGAGAAGHASEDQSFEAEHTVFNNRSVTFLAFEINELVDSLFSSG